MFDKFRLKEVLVKYKQDVKPNCHWKRKISDIKVSNRQNVGLSVGFDVGLEQDIYTPRWQTLWLLGNTVNR